MTNLDLEKRVGVLEGKVRRLEQLSQNEKNISNLKNSQKKQSIREFLSDKDLNNDTQRTLAIAYFFEVIKKKGPFNVYDLKDSFNAAKFTAPSNINDRVNQNVKSCFIMDDEKKKDGKKAWVLTDSGEKEVENNLNKSNE